MMAIPLQQVDRLTIWILVDNCIEWMTKLPAGFTHEIAQHLQHSPPIDEHTGAPVADLDNYCCGAHGLSLLLTTERDGAAYSLLFDTGPDARALERNYAALDVARLAPIERVVLSHWHRDHSGGLLALLNLLAAQTQDGARAPVTVDVHPDRPAARGLAAPDGGAVVCRLPPDPTFAELAAAGARVERRAEGHVVGGGAAWVSGAVPRVTAFERGLPGAVRWVADAAGRGAWAPEPHIMDERYVAVDVRGKGLVLFSACSHAGIVNVVKDAVAKFARPIYMIMGGLHLGGSELEARIPPTVDFLARQLRPAPTFVVPLHCSGFAAKVALAEALGEGCVPGGAGMKVEVRGDPDGERHMFAARVS